MLRAASEGQTVQTHLLRGGNAVPGNTDTLDVNLKISLVFFSVQGRDDKTVITMERTFAEIHGYYKVYISTLYIHILST